MTVKNHISFWIGFFLFLPLFAQIEPATIQVLDSNNHTPVYLAHVKFTCIATACANQSKWTITNAEGFVINPFNDTAFIEVSYLGYENYSDTFIPSISKVILLQTSVFGLKDVVITAQFTPIEKDNSVYEVKTITNEEISKKGANNLRETLSNEINFKSNNGHANETAVILNGLSGNHVKIMIDGVPVEGRINGNIDLSQINLNDIERVEIIEGPTSVVYGTNALGGVINLITKKQQSKKLSVGINTYFESVGQYNFSAKLGFKVKKNTFKISAGRNFFDGYTSQDTARYQDWKPREQYFGSLMFNRNFGHLKLSYIFDGFSETMISKGAPRYPYYTTAFDTYYKTKRFSNKLLLSGRVSKHKFLDVTLSQSYYQRSRSIYFKDLVSLESTPSSSVNDQDTTNFNALMARGVLSTSNDSNKLNYLIGAELKHDFIDANRVENNQQDIGDYAVFGNIRYTPNKSITIQPALRYSYNTKYNAPVVPSINFLLKLKENTQIRASYAKGFRAPSLKELYLEFHYNATINLYGNENLNAENSDHINVSFDYFKTKNKHKFRVVPRAYYSRINHLIDLVQTSEVNWTYMNVDYLTTKGVSLAFEYEWKQINYSVTGSYYGNYNSMFDRLDYTNDYFYSSDIASKLSYTFDSLGVTMSCFYKYTGEIRNSYITDNDEVKPSYIGDFHTFDFTAKKGFWKNKVTLVAGVKNIFDVKDVELVGNVFGVSSSSNSPTLSVLWGRTFFVSLNANF